MDKETLQKKIENGDIVWGFSFFTGKKRIDEIDLQKNEPEIIGGLLYVWDKDLVEHNYGLESIFATKEEAEWKLEFSDVTRTEKLELPTWEQMQEIERFDFKGKDGHTYRMYFMSGFRTLAVVGIIKNEYYGEATYENYLEACRICKKLFLGEEL